MRLLFYFILYAGLGVALELFWTALTRLKKDRNPRAMGTSTLWMFPIYGCVLFIVLLVQWLYGDYPWWMRGFMYMGLIMVWEYFSGWLVRSLVGVAPWEYAVETEDGMGSPKRWQLGGLICLEYAPLWFILGLIGEWFFLFLQSHVLF